MCFECLETLSCYKCMSKSALVIKVNFFGSLPPFLKRNATHTQVYGNALGAGECVEQCCTACQLISHNAYYSEGMHEVRMEIMAALMRELPHTATATHLHDSLESRLPKY